MRQLPKIMIHEHLDCSLRPLTMLELWEEFGFQKAKIPFPEHVLDLWERASHEPAQTGLKLKEQAAAEYQEFLVGFASQSLTNYLNAIGDHILSLMQTPASLNAVRLRWLQSRIR